MFTSQDQGEHLGVKRGGLPTTSYLKELFSRWIPGVVAVVFYFEFVVVPRRASDVVYSGPCAAVLLGAIAEVQVGTHAALGILDKFGAVVDISDKTY